MSNIDRSFPLDAATVSVLSVATPIVVGHDDGLSHDHHWAREIVAARGTHPVVADRSGMSTPSSVTHDDIHYA